MPAGPEFAGNWKLEKKLGQGGFGEVQHWKNFSTGQEIASKHLKNVESISADQQQKLKDRWMKEYNWTLDLEFQNQTSIVAGVRLKEDLNFIEYLKQQHIWNLPVIILEYCNGGDVRNLLRQPQNANGLVEFEVRAILGSLRHSIDFLHTHCGICHRDLKPDNIVINVQVNGQKVYKLTDFGLARNAPDKTMLQSVVGTRHYYAPEVVETGKYNNKVDYWSMGVIAYEIACGVLPFIPHETPFNIHINVKEKPRHCIAITENPYEPGQFQFHSDLPVANHLSKPFALEFTKWLTLALDANYSSRGGSVATDEVQGDSKTPLIFREIDRLLNMKVLTIFDMCSCKLLEYELTQDMTMKNLCSRIRQDTKLPATSLMYCVLPTGHPHRQIKPETQPIDLYVAEWCDTNEKSSYPSVMAYILNFGENATYTTPEPSLPRVLQYCIDKGDKGNISRRRWLMERMILDMHYVLNREHKHMKMQLLGFKEYALSLENDIMNYQPFIKNLDRDKDKCCGAMEQFQTLVDATQQYEHRQLQSNNEWQMNREKLSRRLEEINISTDKILHHFNSILRNVRETSINQSKYIYEDQMKSDIYKIGHFREIYLERGSLSCSKCNNIAIDYAHARHKFFNDEKIEYMRKTLNQTHYRFSKIPEAVKNAHQNFSKIRELLLQLQLQMISGTALTNAPSITLLNNAMSQLSFHASNCEIAASLNTFGGISTDSVIMESLRLKELLESDMDVDQTERS